MDPSVDEGDHVAAPRLDGSISGGRTYVYGWTTYLISQIGLLFEKIGHVQ